MAAELPTPSADFGSFEVVVVGAGPVGLISAIQLGRAGVRTLVLERRSSFSVHPKASGIHARTMEIYRQLGLAGVIRANSADWEGVFRIGWMTRLAGVDLGSIAIGETQEEQDLFASWSPEAMAFCSQDIYEPLFAEQLKQYPSVELRLGHEVTAVAQDDTGVSVDFKAADKRTGVVRAQYVIAADGVRSPIRSLLGVSQTASPSFGTSINVVFEADLERYRAGREFGLFWIVNGDTQGAFGWRRLGNLWSYNLEAEEGVDLTTYTPERCAEIIRSAVGASDIQIDVLSILHWRHDQAVTDQWRVGRIFLAGDSAHRFPPHGGFGMNSGVQDSHNLVWKLIARLRWGAGDGLLDSYQMERRPVAEFNGEQCLVNTRRMQETGWLMRDPSKLATIEAPEGESLRAMMRSAIPKQREQLFSQGQQFGQIYRSTAVLSDGLPIPESTVSDYRPSGSPGARAPHIWLEPHGGKPRSTVDLHDGGFILLASSGGEGWLGAAAAASLDVGAPLAAYCIGGEGYAQRDETIVWQDLVGIGPTGAILVRPDGYVGARWAATPSSPREALGAALRQMLQPGSDRA